jgi:hypothetical protein
MQTKYLNVSVVFVYNMSPRTTKRPKGESHSVRIDKDLEKWVESKIASRQLGSWSHAIEWGLSLLKEKIESKK